MTLGRYQLALLDLTTPGGVTVQRWHSRPEWGSFTYESQSWSFQPFEHDGVSEGGGLDEATASLRLPRLPSLEAVLRQAHHEQWRGRLRLLHWDEDLVTTGAPPSEAFTVATVRGALALQNLTATTMEAGLDSQVLAGQGSGMFPPTVATSTLIGIPVALGGNR